MLRALIPLSRRLGLDVDASVTQDYLRYRGATLTLRPEPVPIRTIVGELSSFWADFSFGTSKYAGLAELALSLTTALASEACAERLFSLEGRINAPSRSRSFGEYLAVTAFLRSNLEFWAQTDSELRDRWAGGRRVPFSW